jgi:hypothetical protein
MSGFGLPLQAGFAIIRLIQHRLGRIVLLNRERPEAGRMLLGKP